MELRFDDALFCAGSSLTIQQCIITGNKSEWCGGIFCCESNMEVTGCIVSNNTGIIGGIMCGYGSSKINQCNITGNSSTNEEEGSGGLYSYRANPYISDCTVSYNSGPVGRKAAARLDEMCPCLDNGLADKFLLLRRKYRRLHDDFDCLTLRCLDHPGDFLPQRAFIAPANCNKAHHHIHLRSSIANGPFRLRCLDPLPRHRCWQHGCQVDSAMRTTTISLGISMGCFRHVAQSCRPYQRWR